MGRQKTRIPKPAGPVPNKGTGAKLAWQNQLDVVNGLVWLNRTIGNLAVNAVMEGMKANGAPLAPPVTEAAKKLGDQGVCELTQNPDPWGNPQSPECGSLNEHWAAFQKHMDAIWNQDISTEEKMQVWGDWGQYLSSEEFDKIQKDHYWVQARYEKYLKFYNLDRPGQPHDINFSVSFGDPAQQRAELASDTLSNMESSLLGAVFEGVASLFTDDPVKLNAASGMGANINDIATAHAGAREIRDSHPSLSASAPEITSVSGSKEPAMETPTPTPTVQPEPTGGAAATGHQQTSAPEIKPEGGTAVAPNISNNMAPPAAPPPAPKITKLPPGPEPPAQTIGVKDEPLPEGTHKVTTTLKPRTSSLKDEQVLRENLEHDGIPVPAGHAAHHMVLKRGGGHWGEVAREELERLGIGINDADNGVPLPGTNRPRGTVDEPTGGPYHGTIHTQAYYREIAERLGRAQTEEEGREALRQIRQDIIDGTFPH